MTMHISRFIINQYDDYERVIFRKKLKGFGHISICNPRATPLWFSPPISRSTQSELSFFSGLQQEIQRQDQPVTNKL